MLVRFSLFCRGIALESRASDGEILKHDQLCRPLAPHIGHLHSTLLADVYTRYHALRSPQLPSPILCTGTDEHGLKIQRVAEGKGITPGALCDDVSERFRVSSSPSDVHIKQRLTKSGGFVIGIGESCWDRIYGIHADDGGAAQGSCAACMGESRLDASL